MICLTKTLGRKILSKINSAKYREKPSGKPKRKKCEYCDKLFPFFRDQKRFCNSICRERSRNRSPVLVPIPCQECNQIFTPVSSTNVLCSKNCRYIRDKKRKYKTGYTPQILEPKVCLVCKKTFQPKAGSQKYCGPVCNSVVHLKRNRSKIKHDRKLKCWICSTIFKPATSKSRGKFCSDQCRKVHYRNKSEEKRKNLEIQAKQDSELQDKWNSSFVEISSVPADSMFPEEIIKFLNNGGLITKYLNPIWAAGSKVNEYEDNLLD